MILTICQRGEHIIWCKIGVGFTFISKDKQLSYLLKFNAIKGKDWSIYENIERGGTDVIFHDSNGKYNHENTDIHFTSMSTVDEDGKIYTVETLLYKY